MRIFIAKTKKDLGKESAKFGARQIRQAIADKGHANIVFATGVSQLEMISSLVLEDINWRNVNGFHLDEYIGLSMGHNASFRKYLKDKLVNNVNPGAFYFIDVEHDISDVCRHLGEEIKNHPIDVAFIGIGENAHLAFNDPPADFQTEEAFIQVDLDIACRMQQLNEGWFSDLSDVPTRAVTMTIQQILKSKSIICSVPDKRKSNAIKSTLTGKITQDVPASILRTHPNVQLFLDKNSSSEIMEFPSWMDNIEIGH